MIDAWEARALAAEGAVALLGRELEECHVRIAELELELLLTARLDRDRLGPVTRLNRQLRERVAELEGS